jgi:hypothetical protein
MSLDKRGFKSVDRSLLENWEKEIYDLCKKVIDENSNLQSANELMRIVMKINHGTQNPMKVWQYIQAILLENNS